MLESGPLKRSVENAPCREDRSSWFLVSGLQFSPLVLCFVLSSQILEIWEGASVSVRESFLPNGRVRPDH